MEEPTTPSHDAHIPHTHVARLAAIAALGRLCKDTSAILTITRGMRGVSDDTPSGRASIAIATEIDEVIMHGPNKADDTIIRPMRPHTGRRNGQ